MRPPLQGLPRTSRWLLIQVRPPKPSCLLSTMAGLYCLCTQTTTAFCFPFSRKKIYVLAIFLSYEIDSFLAFTAMLQWLFTNGGIHTCHGHQALFFFFFARTCPVSAHREKGLESRCELNSELIIGFSLATATLDKRSTKTFSNYAIGTISKEDRRNTKSKNISNSLGTFRRPSSRPALSRQHTHVAGTSWGTRTKYLEEGGLETAAFCL